MDGTLGFQEVRLLPPDHQQIGSYKSNNINSEQVLGTFSVLTISSLSPQASVRSEKKLLTSFSVGKKPENDVTEIDSQRQRKQHAAHLKPKEGNHDDPV